MLTASRKSTATISRSHNQASTNFAFSTMNKPANAFVLRQSPSGVSQLESVSLPKNVIVNGWSAAKRLIGEKDYWNFREIISKSCYPDEKTLLKAGYGAASMWRFLNGKKVGNWVVIPWL